MTIEHTQETSAQLLEQVLVRGDLKLLNDSERMSFYKKLCESLGLNLLTRPFEYITLQGKMTLYARKDATDQLRKINKVSITDVDVKNIGDTYIVTLNGKTPDGRCDTDMGVVSISGLRGDALANALMKAITKAKRRVTLSICGLGMLDETELETIPELKNVTPKEKPKEDILKIQFDFLKESIASSLTMDELKTSYIKSIQAAKSFNDPERICAELTKIKDVKKNELTEKLSDDFFEEPGAPNV